MKKSCFIAVLVVGVMMLIFSCSSGSAKKPSSAQKAVAEQVDHADALQAEQERTTDSLEVVALKKELKTLIHQISTWVVKDYEDNSFRPSTATTYLSAKKFVLTKGKHSWKMNIDYFNDETQEFDEKMAMVTCEDYVYTLHATYSPKYRVFDQDWALGIQPEKKNFLAVAFGWGKGHFFGNDTMADVHTSAMVIAYPSRFSAEVQAYLKSLGFGKDPSAEENEDCWVKMDVEGYSPVFIFKTAGDTEMLTCHLTGNG